MKENQKYFTKLFEIINNKKIEETFYFNCLEIAENNKKWHEQYDMSLLKNINEIYLIIHQVRYNLLKKSIF
jgi:hypothetical protein